VIEQQVGYFQTPSSTGAKLERLTNRVYTFHYFFDRTIIIDTDEGLVVTDPFSSEFTRQLKAALAKEGITKPVHTLIYTHYHVDHTRGGHELAPANIVAHVKCPEYWRDFDATDIAPPTRLIQGDEELVVGGVTIRLVYLGLSHTDTMYAVHVPTEGVLYAADTVGVKVFLPVGGVALYMPGYFRALDRMASLDFTTFVGSHFGYGTKQDYLDAIGLQKELRSLVQSAMAHHPGPTPAFVDRDRMLAIFDEVYGPLRDKYASWHGFDAQVLASFINAYVSEVVGN
jgi:glyoxylase-like metal-dependent hydrolase (beta-lactamase superfamily II)